MHVVSKFDKVRACSGVSLTCILRCQVEELSLRVGALPEQPNNMLKVREFALITCAHSLCFGSTT